MQKSSTRRNGLVLVVALLPALALAGVLHWLLSTYSAMLAGFDGASYLPTRVLLAWPYWLPLLPLAVIALWGFWPRPEHRATFAVIVGYFGSVSIFVFGLVAIYWPVYQLGATP